MNTIYLALGTNLDDRLANLRLALQALAPEIKLVAQSLIYETPAWGFEAQPPFLNMVIKAETELEPDALLAHLKHLESGLGRVPSFHWGPSDRHRHPFLQRPLPLDARACHSTPAPA